MSFAFGAKSTAALVGVHPSLVMVARRAIGLTPQDFSVHEGLRTEATQREYVRRGVSTTMNSKHLKQADGFGHAVDLVPYVGGQLRWEWPPIYHIAAAMRAAALELGVPIRWGGVWADIKTCGATAEEIEDDVQAYVARRVRAGNKAFIDGPHYELIG